MESEEFKALRQRAEAGDADAMYELAECYDKGIGVRRNYGKAARCYLIACGLSTGDKEWLKRSLRWFWLRRFFRFFV